MLRLATMFQRPTAMLMQPNLMAAVTCRAFTGKTESGFKWKTPKMRMRKVRPIAPPGLDLQIP